MTSTESKSATASSDSVVEANKQLLKNSDGQQALPYKEAYQKFSSSFFATNVRLEAAFLAHRKKRKLP